MVLGLSKHVIVVIKQANQLLILLAQGRELITYPISKSETEASIWLLLLLELRAM
jgi:hypothetical protein